MNRIFHLSFVVVILLSSCTEELEQANQSLHSRIDSLEVQIQQLKEENNKLRLSLGNRPDVGFEVQIGAFRNFNVKAYEQDLLRLREVNEEGVSKYVLGTFIRFQDAEAFLKDVHEMGVEDAFIAGIVGGERTTVAAAREAAKIAYGF